MIGPSDLLHPSPTTHFKSIQVFLIYCTKRPSFSTIQSQMLNVANFFHYGVIIFNIISEHNNANAPYSKDVAVENRHLRWLKVTKSRFHCLVFVESVISQLLIYESKLIYLWRIVILQQDIATAHSARRTQA